MLSDFSQSVPISMRNKLLHLLRHKGAESRNDTAQPSHPSISPPFLTYACEKLLPVPAEIWLAILYYLNPSEAWRIRHVCTLLRDVVEQYISLSWLANRPFTPTVVYPLSGNAHWHYFGGSFQIKEQLLLSPRREQPFIKCVLRPSVKSIYDRCQKARKGLDLWYDIFKVKQRSALKKLESIPPWVCCLDRGVLSLEFDIYQRSSYYDNCVYDAIYPFVTLYSRDAGRVKTGQAVPGFQLHFDGEVPALLIDWRVLLTSLFMSETLRRWLVSKHFYFN